MAVIIKGKNPRKPWTVRYFHENRQRERSFATAGEARDFKAKFEHDRRESVFADPRDGRVEFVAYAGAWIEGLDRPDSTKKTYRSVLAARLAKPLAGRTLAQVAADRAGVWELVSGLPLSASRKSTALTVIVGACTEAVRVGKLARHRLDGMSVTRSTVSPAVIIPATGSQLRTLAGGLRPGLALTVWLMIGCGLRISEALAVRLDGFRDGGKVLRVSEQVRSDHSLGPLKARKRGEYRDVPVPGWLWVKVQAHVAQFGTDDGYLFGTDGHRVSYNEYHQRFTRSAGKAGLAGLTEHGLRHLYASTLLNRNVPVFDVSTWMGHRDIRITCAVYGHLLPDSWPRGRSALESLSPDADQDTASTDTGQDQPAARSAACTGLPASRRTRPAARAVPRRPARAIPARAPHTARAA